MRRATGSVVGLMREGALDAQLAALIWLLIEGRVPVVVTGRADAQRRDQVMEAILTLPWASGSPPADWARVDADTWPAALTARILALPPGVPFALVARADSLRDLLARAAASTTGLADDEARALGLVVVVGPDGRIDAAHLLRPVERDGQGHLQRRPPAVLASRDRESGALDHFAWGIEPEISDRVDLSERDLDHRLTLRVRVLDDLAAGPLPSDEEQRRLRDHLTAEPPREPAPERPPARAPWPPLQDEPHVH